MFEGIDWNSTLNGILVVTVGFISWIGKRWADGKPPIPVVTSSAPISNPGTAVAPAVEINALVDSRSLSQHTAAMEALNLTMMTGLKQQRDHSERLDKRLEVVTEKLHGISIGLTNFDGISKELRGMGYAIDKAVGEIRDLQDEVKSLTLETARNKR